MTRKMATGPAALAALAMAVGGLAVSAAAQAQQKAPAKAVPAAAAAAKAQTLTGTWDVDTTHTDIGFTVTHLGVSKVRGRFNEYGGAVKIDGAKPQNSSVNFTIQAKSVDTGNAQRDGHLRAPDFFDVEKYPTITFKSTRVTPAGPNKFTARGMLTMHGVTKAVELPFTVQGPGKGMQGEWRLGVETAVKLDRRDYGLTWNRVVEGGAVVGNQIDIAIHLELVKQSAAAKTASSR